MAPLFLVLRCVDERSCRESAVMQALAYLKHFEDGPHKNWWSSTDA